MKQRAKKKLAKMLFKTLVWIARCIAIPILLPIIILFFAVETMCLLAFNLYYYAYDKEDDIEFRYYFSKPLFDVISLNFDFDGKE